MNDTDNREVQADIAALGRKATHDEIDDVARATQIERDWWGQVAPFNDSDDVFRAVSSSRIVKVEPHSAFLPILRYRNPELAHAYPPYLEAHTLALLKMIAQEWRRRADEVGISQDARLAVTSLTTTTSYQEILVKAGKMAIKGNPHSRGVAFDFDATGYYLGDAPVNHRPQDKNEFDAAFAETGHAMKAPDFLSDPKLFNPEVHRILRNILDDYQSSGYLHYIQEYPGTHFSSFHVCRNPQFRPESVV